MSSVIAMPYRVVILFCIGWRLTSVGLPQICLFGTVKPKEEV